MLSNMLITNENHESAELSSQGFQQMFERNYHEAISIFDKAIEVFPDSALAFHGRSLCQMLLLPDTDPDNHLYLITAVESDLTQALACIKDMIKFIKSNSA